MEVKFVKNGYEDQFLCIYIDGELWKTVKARYFFKKVMKLADKEDFKEKFLMLEEKKCRDLGLYLLSKKAYLKKQWVEKLKDRLFPIALIEKIYKEGLGRFFNEEEELERMIQSYVLQGKGGHWIKNKLRNDISIDISIFDSILSTYCNKEIAREKIKEMIESRNLLEVKGKEKTIAFFIRRGFSYNDISYVLRSVEQIN